MRDTKNFVASDVLKRRIEELDVSMSALAEATGINRTLLHAYVSGVKIPSANRFAHIMSCLGMQLDYTETDEFARLRKLTKLSRSSAFIEEQLMGPSIGDSILSYQIDQQVENAKLIVNVVNKGKSL